MKEKEAVDVPYYKSKYNFNAETHFATIVPTAHLRQV